MKRFDIEYVQPELEPGRTVQKQHLMYGRMRGAPLGRSVPRSEAVRVLDTVYNYWYGDYYVDEDSSRDAEHRLKMRKLFETVTANLPESVPMH